MSGNGFFNWVNGDVYIGVFIVDQFYGKGVFMQVNGIKYEGNWINGKCNGEFIVILKDGIVFCGIWKFGVVFSNVIVVLVGGELYSGLVSGGFLLNGKGICIKVGKLFICEYKVGKKVVVVVVVFKLVLKFVFKLASVVKVFVELKVDVKLFDGGAAAALVVVEVLKLKDFWIYWGECVDGSQFFFKYSWGGVSEGFIEFFVEKDINEFGVMQIKVFGGGFDIVFMVDEYIGFVIYKLVYFKVLI